jgi:cob(I)alamin adenosyltransferase
MSSGGLSWDLNIGCGKGIPGGIAKSGINVLWLHLGSSDDLFPRKYAIFSPANCSMTLDSAPMVSQLKVAGLSASPQSSVIRHPLLQTIEGTLQVFTAVHRSFFTNVMVQALRLAEQGKAVLIVQFLKGGIHQGADQPMQFGQNLDWIRCDMPHCIHGPEVDAAERQAVKALWQHTQAMVSKGHYSLVVLDELSLAMNYNLIPTQQVVNFLQQRPPQVDVILTGPEMPEVLLNMADQVTEFRRNFLP